MKKSRLSLLVVATVIATILVAGCSLPTQTSPQVASSSSNTSSTNASTATKSSSSAVKTASSVKPSPSASATPTAVPPASGKIPTSIAATGLNSPLVPTFTNGKPINFAIPVTSYGITVCGGTVTVLMNGQSIGHVNSGGASGCFKTAYFTLSGGLPKGTYTLILSYSGDSTHQPSTSPATITVS